MEVDGHILVVFLFGLVVDNNKVNMTNNWTCRQKNSDTRFTHLQNPCRWSSFVLATISVSCVLKEIPCSGSTRNRKTGEEEQVNSRVLWESGANGSWNVNYVLGLSEQLLGSGFGVWVCWHTKSLSILGIHAETSSECPFTNLYRCKVNCVSNIKQK